MKFISVDIETTGLDPVNCQILEIGAVVGDFERHETEPFHAFDSEPFHCFVQHREIVGEPYALAMNHEILDIIANPRKYLEYNFFSPDEVVFEFDKWLGRFKFQDKITFAGKNFAGFDLQFLKQLYAWEDIRYSHRFLDVGSVYFDPKCHKAIPSLQECLEMARMEGVVTHRAVEDAQLVVDLLRWKFGV